MTVLNERLRDAILRNGHTSADVAAKIHVDTKTVERWITLGRTPYPKHRHAIAALLQSSERYLWPEAISRARAARVDESEVLGVFPHRNDVPRDLWDRLFHDASARIELLVYVGMFLTENPAFIVGLRAKADAGVRVRLLFGDPSSREVSRRSMEEGIGKEAISVKIRNALALVRPLDGHAGIDIRCHGTTLYNSIFRYDDDMIVNTHVYGLVAPHAPAIHLKRLSAGDLFETYARSFEAVWETAKLPKW